MKHRSTQHKNAERQAHPVVPDPDGYKGQALLPDLIYFSEQLSRYPKKYLGFFKLLLTEFAREVGCGTTAESLAYLGTLERGESYFWSHAELPDIFLVSTLMKLGMSNQRVIKIMPSEQMFGLLRYDAATKQRCGILRKRQVA